MVLMHQILRILRDACTSTPDEPYAFPSRWDPSDWELFFNFAQHHRVTPLLGHRAQNGVLENIPAPLMAKLQKELHQTRLRHRVALQQLDEVESGLRGKGISCYALKGPRLADEAYPTPGLRRFDDLDILVEPAARSEAQRVLADLGYRPPPRRLPAWLVRSYHFHTQWFHPATHTLVELHERPADTRSLPRAAGDFSYLTELQKNPAALPVYLAVHLAKHGLANGPLLRQRLDPLLALHPWYGIRLIWLLDFQGILAARRISDEALTETARQWQAEGALALARYLSIAPASEPGPTPASRFLKRLAKEMDEPAVLRDEPWWLRPSALTGFRPVRLLDLLPGSTT